MAVMLALRGANCVLAECMKRSGRCSSSLCLTRLSLGFLGQDFQSFLLMGDNVTGGTICREFGSEEPESCALTRVFGILWEQRLLSSFPLPAGGDSV